MKNGFKKNWSKSIECKGRRSVWQVFRNGILTDCVTFYARDVLTDIPSECLELGMYNNSTDLQESYHEVDKLRVFSDNRNYSSLLSIIK